MLPNPTPCLVCGYPATASATRCAACGEGARSVRGGFFAGMAAYVGGLGMLVAHKRLRRTAALPFLVSAAIFVALFVALWMGTAGWREAASTAPWMPSWLQGVAGALLAVVIFVFFSVAAWFLAAPITAAVAAPALDVLVGQADEEVLGSRRRVEMTLLGDTGFGLAQGLLSTAATLPLCLLALAAAWIPPFGPPASFVFLAFFTGFVALDVAASRRRWTLRQKLLVARENLSALFGFGLVGASLALVPGLALVIGIPVSATGGALLLRVIDLRASRLTDRP